MPESIPPAWIIDSDEHLEEGEERLPLPSPLGWEHALPTPPPTERPAGSQVIMFDI
jgi:hypothetical protein